VEYDLYLAIQEVEKEMLAAAEALEFERAALLRDELLELRRAAGPPSGEPPGGPVSAGGPVGVTVGPGLRRKAGRGRKGGP